MSAQGSGETRLSDQRRVRWLKTHRKGCWALENARTGKWSTAWAYLRERVYRDALGRKGASTHAWWLVGCNDPKCPAQLLLAEDWILERLPNV